MADGKVVIETDLDASGIKKGLSKIESITSQGLKVAAATISGVSVALTGVSTAAIKVGSDFEAQMSRVKAISGATGEEFEKLKNQAIQLGADTAFSSTQAAEGMENLAAAGFATNEIIEAMPGLLDLAAASGEDLANSSDIAASTLRGFGLAASDAGHVADVLAENANRTNSSVAETGEAMKYIAPLARAVGISMEETAAAIGIMANAGIQGSQAGTTLRGAFSRLSKPTDDMQLAMDQLGISFYDSEGKMKSLSKQVAMLKDAMSDMTDEQKNNYLVTLYGQEALSGMLALINEGPESLNELSKAYETCDGSAKTAAETMQDNLKGAVEQLKGSAESLGIAFYDSVSENMKNAAVQATDSINQITDAFNNGGLDAAIETAGNEFATLATKAAEHAPEMVDSAVDFIQAFTNGIISNRGKLINAAGETAEAFADGIAELLPEELREPVDDAIEMISESLSSGGLKKAGETAVNTFENVIDAVGELADVALPPLIKAVDFAGEHIELLAVSATTAFTAFKGYKAVSNTSSVISKATKAWKTAATAVDAYNVVQMACTSQGVVSNATLTVGQAAVGVLTGKVSLATAAQTAWNAVMSANPIGIVVTSVVALVAGLTALSFVTSKQTEEEKKHTKELENSKKAAEEHLEVAKKQTESYKELSESQNKQAASEVVQLDNLKLLNDELQGIVDANGKVKEGEENRATFITSQLSDALGIEIAMTDGIIQNYGELQEQIKSTIQQKKIDAVMTAQQAKYEEAVAKQMQIASDASDALTAKKKAENEVKKESAKLSKLETDYAEAVVDGNKAQVKIIGDKIERQKENLKTAEDTVKKESEAYKENTELLKQYSADIDLYTSLAEAAASGNAEAIENAIAQITSGVKTASNATNEELEKQVVKVSETERLIREEVEKGTPGFTSAMLSQAQSATSSALEEYAKIAPQTAAELSKVPPEAVAALIAGDMKGKLSEEASGSVQGMLGSISSLTPESKNAILELLKPMLTETELSSVKMKINGDNAGTGYTEGVGSKKAEAKKQGEVLADNAKEGADTGKKKGEDAGSDFGAGFIDGIGSKIESAMEKAGEFASSVLGALKNALGIHSPSRKAREVGNFFGRGFALGIQDDENMVRSASEDIANTALSSLNMPDISARMREAMAVNTGRVTRSFALETNTNLLSHSEAEVLMKLSEEDIEKLAYLFGSVAGEKVADSVDGMTMEVDGRPFGRVIKEALE